MLSALLFEAPDLDTGAIVAAVSVLLAVAFSAAWIPSLRAASVQPVEALRHE